MSDLSLDDSTSPPLSILHLTAGSDAGGVSRYLFDLCSAAQQQGHRVAIAGEHGAWHELFENAPWPWIDLPLKGGVWSLWRAARTLRQYVRNAGVDVLHCHYRRSTLVARHIQKRDRPPILFTLHLTGIEVGGWQRRFSDFGDLTHAPSQEATRWLIAEAGVDEQRIVTIEHGIDPARFPRIDASEKRRIRRSLGLPEQGRIAGYVGRFDEPKNEDWLLDLAERSGDVLPDLTVVLMGEGPHEIELAQAIQSRGLADRVKLIPYGDPLAMYQACDLLLLPSAREGFSLVCCEAMSTGCPVLRTRTAGWQEQIIEGVTGRSVPIDREQFIAAAMEMLQDEDSLTSMGDAAANHVRERLRFSDQVQRTLSLYEQLAQHAANPVTKSVPNARKDSAV